MTGLADRNSSMASLSAGVSGCSSGMRLRAGLGFFCADPAFCGLAWLRGGLGFFRLAVAALDLDDMSPS
jgi:hypothetical protein